MLHTGGCYLKTQPNQISKFLNTLVNGKKCVFTKVPINGKISAGLPNIFILKLRVLRCLFKHL